MGGVSANYLTPCMVTCPQGRLALSPSTERGWDATRFLLGLWTLFSLLPAPVMVARFELQAEGVEVRRSGEEVAGPV